MKGLCSWPNVFAAAVLVAACSSGSPARGEEAPADAALPPVPLAPPPPPIEVATPRPVKAPAPDLAETIAAARAAAGEREEPDQQVTLYEVSADPPSVIETGDVWLHFQRYLDKNLRRCYRSALRKDRSARGRITLRLRVGRGGSIDRVETVNAFDDEVAACAARYAGGWRFTVLADDVGAWMTMVVGFEP